VIPVRLRWPKGLQLVRLQAENSVVELSPEIGGSVAAFYNERYGQRFDWLRPANPDALSQRVPQGMASYPLVPFCNRIRHGRFRFGRRSVTMPLNVSEPHVLHGFGWQRAWEVVEQHERSARLRLEHRGGAWPWPFTAEQIYRVEPMALHVTLEVMNTGDEPMPIGIGHHPYFPHRAGTRLQANVNAMWETDVEIMPTKLVRAPLLSELREGLLLADVVQDNNFVGWHRWARVLWPEQQAQVTLHAQSPLNFFVLYVPADKNEKHFCIEGVSNCTDWLNLQDLPQAVVGGHVILPGQSIAAMTSFVGAYEATSVSGA
jgi:aldose 1-epimerase